MTILTLLVLLFVQAPELREQYLCQGSTPQGSYEMVLRIEKKDDNYHIAWLTPQGVQARGVGFVEGEHFTAVFITVKDNIGVISYRITKVGLDGKWISGNGMKFTENCSFGVQSKV